MNQEELQKLGCKKINWNPAWDGGFFEWYAPVKGDGRGLKDSRLSVIFGEHPDHPVLAWLVLPGYKLALPHVTTIEQFCQMYTLLTGRSLTMRAGGRTAGRAKNQGNAEAVRR